MNRSVCIALTLLSNNVYLQPWAYRHFVDTGKFPEGSMFVLSLSVPSTEAAPARAGHYPKDPMPMFEVHVKRAGIDSTGWDFYNFGPGAGPATKIPGSASCYSCHAKEAKVDHVFVQFYPALRRFVRP